MTFQWTRLLTKRDGSGYRHVYGAFSISETDNSAYCPEVYTRHYTFYGKQGHLITINRYYDGWGMAGLHTTMVRKKKEGYIDMTEGQLKGKWDDLKSQCEQFILFETLKGR